MQKLIVKHPFSGETIHTVELDSIESVADKVSSLQAAQKSWSQISITDRIQFVKEGLSYFENHRQEIANDISQQMGRPAHQALGEINGFFERADYMCEIAQQTLQDDIIEKDDGITRRIQHVPQGVLFVISAWNYPLLITVNSVIPALIAGNTVLLKHSSLTPLIGQHFENAFRNLGDFKNLVINTSMDHATTGKTIEDLPVDHVIFTGSVSGGRTIAGHCSRRFINPGLELGGKDAAYIHKSADLKATAEMVVDGAMFNSGQSCCGIERVFIDQDAHDEFIELASHLIDQYKLGDPSDKEVSMGPLASAKSADFMKKQVDQAIAQGATLVKGGHIEKIGNGTFFQPTLLTNCKANMDVCIEENFGPILAVTKVNSVEQAIELTNDNAYGLTASIFAKDEKVIEEFTNAAEVGTVFANRCDYLDPSLPWTGVKDSGVGSALSKYGFYAVTRRKGYHLKKG